MTLFHSEKTKTYVRFYLGQIMIQFPWNTEDRAKRRSVKLICYMIGVTDQLTDMHKREYRDYLNAVLRDEEK